MSRTTLFVDVILPLAVPNLYTYRVPYELNDSIVVGQRVVVQFGKGKLYSALVRTIHENPPKQYVAKYLDSVLDEHPIVNEKQFELWDWMSAYYMCTIGEVMVAALPGGLRLSSETKIILSSEYKELISKTELSDKEYLIVDALEVRNVLSITDVSQIIEQKTVYPVIKRLIEKGVIIIQEELKEKFKPKIESFVKLTENNDNENSLKTIFDSLEKKASKQLDVLMAYIKLSDRYSKNIKDVKKKDLLKLVEGGEAAIKGLVKKNIFELHEREVGRFVNYAGENKLSELNEIQQTVFESINKQFYQDIPLQPQNLSHQPSPKESIGTKEDLSQLGNNSLSFGEGRREVKDVVLLHGVTSSGKTEIYIKLIEQALAQGKQVLYLLPEIALTTQIINRLRKNFGDAVGVYHSKFNENERVEIWNNVLGNQIQDIRHKIIN